MAAQTNPIAIFKSAMENYQRTLKESTELYANLLNEASSEMEKMLTEAAEADSILSGPPEPVLPKQIVIEGESVKHFITALDILLNGLIKIKESIGIK